MDDPFDPWLMPEPHNKWVAALSNDQKWLPPVVAIACPAWLIYALVFRPPHPPIGTYIGVLALLAVVVTIWPPDSPRRKAAWLLVFFICFGLEVSTLYRDRSENQAEQAATRREEDKRSEEARKEEDTRFETAKKQENQSFAAILANNQRQFEATMARLTESDRRDRSHFESLLNEDRQLFEHEERLAESTSGVLQPGTAPVTNNECVASHPDGFAVLYGDNTSVINYFPHYIVVTSTGPLITIDRAADQKIIVTMDVRDQSGKIVARLDENGYVIGSRLMIRHPDKSTLVVFDEYGKKALDLKYLNPKALALNGYLYSGGKVNDIQLPNFHHSCTFWRFPNPGSGDIFIQTSPLSWKPTKP